jgi:hypothetical protein
LKSAKPSEKNYSGKKVAVHVHDHLAPALLVATFSIESVRARLEKENHPFAEHLKEIQQKLTGTGNGNRPKAEKWANFPLWYCRVPMTKFS